MQPSRNISLLVRGTKYKSHYLYHGPARSSFSCEIHWVQTSFVGLFFHLFFWEFIHKIFLLSSSLISVIEDCIYNKIVILYFNVIFNIILVLYILILFIIYAHILWTAQFVQSYTYACFRVGHGYWINVYKYVFLSFPFKTSLCSWLILPELYKHSLQFPWIFPNRISGSFFFHCC